MNDSILVEVMNTLELKGSVVSTVELIDGGVARVRVGEMVMPAVLASCEVLVVELMELEALRLKHDAVPPIEENPDGQPTHVELE